MKRFVFLLAVALTFPLASCSKKSAPDKTDAREVDRGEKTENDAEEAKGESEGAPEPNDIGEDCVAFLRATRAVPADRASGDCVGCSTNDYPEVLKFTTFEVGKISTSKDRCTVEVKIHAEFNPSTGGTIAGGLVGWIAPEERKQYTAGITPKGPQVYAVTVTYSRTRGVWRPVEFARTD